MNIKVLLSNKLNGCDQDKGPYVLSLAVLIMFKVFLAMLNLLMSAMTLGSQKLLIVVLGANKFNGVLFINRITTLSCIS